MRYVELFAGAGGMSLGLERAGLTCVAHAELADFPRRVLKHRWPDVPLYGDVSTVDGRALVAEHGPIDLLAGGSPCQDLSTSGKRAGLSGGRSGLFYQQMRLWDETGADLCLWENVDGARSSNEARDFGEVLRAFVGAAIAVPSDGWRSAGVAAGPLGVAAWRVLDAQYFGVPQGRRRIFVLGTRAGSLDPAEVLHLSEAGRWAPPARDRQGQGDSRRPAGDAGADSRLVWAFNHNQDGSDFGPVVSTLRCNNEVGVLYFRRTAIGEHVLSDHSSTLAARDFKDPTDLVVCDGRIRRLLPVEHERLMGWPDGWTDVPDATGKPASDAVRYKATGNGVVSHCSQWIGERLLQVAA